ncbi:MAG: hypothetical protein AAGG09_02335 [Pseudomonadota bacterium]
MTRRIVGIATALALAALLFFASRYWSFRLWDRPGLFGWEALPPQGGLVRGWLRGTQFAVYDIIIWAIAAFVLLTLVQKIADAIARRSK